MASSSQAATCNGGDGSGTIDGFEEAMWIRLFQVDRDIKADRAASIQANEERLIQSEMSAKAGVAMSNKVAREGISSIKDYIAKCWGVDFDLSNDPLKWLKGEQAANISSPYFCFLLSSLLVLDRQRKWESSFLKLCWRNSNGISDDDLFFLLSKLAEHYSPSHEVENLEEFMFTNEEQATFLNDCSSLDKATRLAKGFNEFSLLQTQGQKPQYWTRRDHTLHSVSFSESVKSLEVIFPFSIRFETAKECLDHLDLLKSVTANFNPDESGTVASFIKSFKSTELQALHALKKEMELYGEVAVQLEQLSGKHLLAYEEMSKDQHESSDEFFRTCEEEKRNMVQEALYKKVKCLASIKKTSVRRQVNLSSSEDILKGMLRKAESTLKEVEAELKKAQSSNSNKSCTLCYLEFSKKRKRACFDPCGHASACIDCATKAWAKKPSCPWCKASIQKPISIPAQIFL